MAMILLGDAPGETRDRLVDALVAAGHRVIAVDDGEAVLAAAAVEPPDAVVLDFDLLGLGATHVTVRLKAGAGALVPVVLVSARDDLPTRLACLAVADDFLPRPFPVEELDARIGAHLRVRRVLQSGKTRAAAATNTLTLSTGSSVTPMTARPRPTTPGEQTLLADLVMRDRTTGLRTREYFQERLAEEWHRAERTAEPIALLVARASVEDGSILAVAGALRRALRRIDVLARNESNELAALMPSTHVGGALAAAARIRKELDGSRRPMGVGLACWPGRDVTGAESLVAMARRAVERAIKIGPGSICLCQREPYLFEPDDAA